nr:unnamed protein product [Callosobruchus chinensis]
MKLTPNCQGINTKLSERPFAVTPVYHLCLQPPCYSRRKKSPVSLTLRSHPKKRLVL